MSTEHEPTEHELMVAVEKMMSTEHELMVAVEKIVRPIAAPEQTKLRMRQELYRHAIDAADHEAERLGDNDAGVREAIARLGGPSETRKELQRTVSLVDRCEWAIERFLRQQPDSSSAWHAMKLFVAGAAAQACFWTALFAIVAWAADNHQRDIHIVPILVASLMTSLFLVLPSVFFTKSYCGLFTYWRTSRRRCLEAVGWQVGVALFLLAMAVAMYAATGPLRQAPLGGVYTAVAIFLALQPIALMIAGLDLWRKRGAGEWLTLDLRESVAE